MKKFLTIILFTIAAQQSIASDLQECDGSPLFKVELPSDLQMWDEVGWHNCQGTLVGEYGNLTVKMEGEWQNFMLNGYGKIYIDEKISYEGEYKDNLPFGKGTQTYSDGKLEGIFGPPYGEYHGPDGVWYSRLGLLNPKEFEEKVLEFISINRHFKIISKNKDKKYINYFWLVGPSTYISSGFIYNFDMDAGTNEFNVYKFKQGDKTLNQLISVYCLDKTMNVSQTGLPDNVYKYVDWQKSMSAEDIKVYCKTDYTKYSQFTDCLYDFNYKVPRLPYDHIYEDLRIKYDIWVKKFALNLEEKGYGSLDNPDPNYDKEIEIMLAEDKEYMDIIKETSNRCSSYIGI